MLVKVKDEVMEVNVSSTRVPESSCEDDPTLSGNISQSTIRFVYVAEGFIQPIILIFGLLTNIASAVVLKKVRMNEVFRICLLSLSVVDALACAVGFIQLVVEVKLFNGNIPQGHMIPGVIASNTLYFMYLMFMCASASIVILIAVIRNCFVLRPMKARARFTSKITRLVCFIAFFITLLLFAPVSLKIISQSCKCEGDKIAVCRWMSSTEPTLHRVAEIYLHYFLSALFGPIIIIIYIVCVICIRVTVQKSVKTLSLLASRKTSAGSSANGRPDLVVTTDARMRSRTAARITKTLLMILILDVICTLPYVLQGVGLLVAKGKSIFDEASDAGKIYDAIVEIFLNLRPSYNFWLYVYQHPEFRIRLKTVIHRMLLPCYMSKCCCCQMELEPITPIQPPWSAGTPSVTHVNPWFQRLPSRIQNGNNLAVPTYTRSMSHKMTGKEAANSQSMDSESDWTDMA